MTRFFWLIFAAIVVLLMIANASEAQGRCIPREVALTQLAEKWGETRRSVMLANGRVFEVYAAEDSGTWTILRTTPDGLSCIIASGIAYEENPTPTGDPA